MKPILVTAIIACLPWFAASQSDDKPAKTPTQSNEMKLGAFSISLAVKDLAVSRDFYAKLGFEKLGGDEKHNYLILKNGTTVIGLFQGMFEENLLTFNPGWDQSAEKVDPFTDIRELQASLIEKGIEPVKAIEADVMDKSGPANFVIADPDGNTILLDQHR